MSCWEIEKRWLAQKDDEIERLKAEIERLKQEIRLLRAELETRKAKTN